MCWERPVLSRDRSSTLSPGWTAAQDPMLQADGAGSLSQGGAEQGWSWGSDLNEGHSTPGLCDAGAQLIHALLHRTQDFGLLSLWMTRPCECRGCLRPQPCTGWDQGSTWLGRGEAGTSRELCQCTGGPAVAFRSLHTPGVPPPRPWEEDRWVMLSAPFTHTHPRSRQGQLPWDWTLSSISSRQEDKHTG